MDEILYKLWFHALPIKTIDKIEILKNTSPMDFFNYNTKQYSNMGIDFITIDKIRKSKEIEVYYKIYEYLKNEKIKFILYNDKEYPERLKYIYSPPVGFFVKGIIPNIENSIAIVGARKATEYGKTVSYKFAYELASRGIVVISGMARGIDGASHRGAIAADGKTIAVLGSGFKNIYPKEHKELFYNICDNGCVITEYFPDMQPLAYNFPERNRIISGLSKYILVVEAGEKSGSLITVDFALEQGKDVFAVPGNIFSYASFGPNKLIKEGAKPVTSVDDILEEYDLFSIVKDDNIKLSNEDEKRIMELLNNGGMNIESILGSLNINNQNIITALTSLECKGYIKRASPNYYIRC